MVSDREIFACGKEVVERPQHKHVRIHQNHSSVALQQAPRVQLVGGGNTRNDGGHAVDLHACAQEACLAVGRQRDVRAKQEHKVSCARLHASNGVQQQLYKLQADRCQAVRPAHGALSFWSCLSAAVATRGAMRRGEAMAACELCVLLRPDSIVNRRSSKLPYPHTP
eukprot:7111535-Prymnesium_polylepis.3